MDFQKRKYYLERFEKLLNEGKKILDECGWDGKNYKNYPSAKEYGNEFVLFLNKSMNLIEQTFGEDYIHYVWLKRIAQDKRCGPHNFYRVHRIIKDAYENYKKIEVDIEAGKEAKLSEEQNEDSNKLIRKLNGNDIAYKISYDYWSRQIFINDILSKKSYKLKAPNYSSENRIIFEFLLNHPEEEVKLKTLEDEVKKELNKTLAVSLHAVARELGFTKELKKIFFTTSKEHASLRIKVTIEQLRKSKVDISKTLKKLSQV